MTQQITLYKALGSIVAVLIASVVLSGCVGNQTGISNKPVSETTTKTTTGAPAANQKSGMTTKSGVISSAGGKFFLQEAGSTPKMIESYAVELSEYVGKTVTVTGQYSGDTLFVGEIKE